MNRKVEIIAYHGWGMNARFWDQWDDLFSDHVTFKKNDRGYFGNSTDHEFSDQEAIHVLFVQGFGIHWVSKENWQKAHVIVLFSGFNNLKDIMKKSRSVDQVVSTLKKELNEKVYTTLGLFWKEMFRSDAYDFIQPDEISVKESGHLIDDLEVYYDDLVKKVPVSKRAKVLLYETQYDDLDTQPQKTIIRELFGKLDYYHRFDFVGHGYPFSKADECYQDLNSKLKIF